ncbi:hypothetical protein EVAR_14824_1 [Eumeta japonica]|uniref:Uncharacterized protein n=1 Tax=Eumeta variegata TaxID=151549 RepID=A0A4C1V2U3_EUMVA|nr:hypothetical protein EVAR_14824_1 [Eumeta japonica]
MVTGAHGHSKPRRDHKYVVGLLETNGISVKEENGLNKGRSGLREEEVDHRNFYSLKNETRRDPAEAVTSRLFFVQSYKILKYLLSLGLNLRIQEYTASDNSTRHYSIYSPMSL